MQFRPPQTTVPLHQQKASSVNQANQWPFEDRPHGPEQSSPQSSVVTVSVGQLSPEPGVVSVDLDSDASDCSALNSDDDFIDELPSLPSTKLTSAYTLLTVEELSDLMKQIVDEVVPVIDLPRHYLRLGLSQFAWDKDRFVEYYYDHGQDELLRMLRLPTPVSLPVRSSLSTFSFLQTDSSSSVFCEICCSSAPPDTLALSCGHTFCQTCWLSYLREQILNEGQGNRISCPAFNCPHVLNDEVALELLQLDAPESTVSSENASSSPLSTMKQRFQKILALSFVQCNPKLTWCPNATCCYVARLHSNIFQEVLSPAAYVDSTVPHPHRIVCVCGEVFCHRCGQSWHEPLQCAVLDLWLKERRDDPETMHFIVTYTQVTRDDREVAAKMAKIAQEDKSRKWISANTKECPKCYAPIEKKGGCEHMKCTNVACNYEFCWRCMGTWDTHRYIFKCPKDDSNSNQQTQDAPLAFGATLRLRYPEYFARYAKHWHWLQEEKKLLYDYTRRIKLTKEMNTPAVLWVETYILKEAVNVLSCCRRALMHTSVFAYYLEANNQAQIFDQNLGDLEQATQCLSEFLNGIYTGKHSFSQMKLQLQDQTRYCESRRVAILLHAYEGYDRGMWHHTGPLNTHT